MSVGAFPPADAQLSRCHVSHLSGLIFHWASVAKSENIVAASRPLHKEPEPWKFFRATAGPRPARSEALLSLRYVELGKGGWM